MSSPDHAFGTSLEIEGGVAVLRVHGDVERSSTRAIRTALLHLAEQGFAEVTADLTAVSSMSPAGFDAVVAVLREVRGAGGAAPPRTQVLLDAERIEELLGPNADGVIAESTTSLGDEMRPGDRSAVIASRPLDLTADIARVGSMPASNAVVDAALRLVTTLAAETVEGADGASVSLQRHGRLATVAASNATVLRMDSHQYDTGEGPCISASEAGHWFHIEALSEERRWTAFVPRAMEEGIASILSTPLLAAERPVGALNIYSDRERVFGPRQQELAALFSAQASGILEDAGASITAVELDQRVRTALRSREVIAHAVGVIMARHDLSQDEAAHSLRGAARAAHTTVFVEAERVVSEGRPSPRSDAARG